MVIKYILFVQEDTQGQRNGSATKSTDYASKGLVFNFQHPYMVGHNRL